MVPCIEASHLTLTFKPKNRDPVTALQGFDLQVSKGEFLSLVGPSGCGKSTFLNVLLGLLKPDSGELSLNGKQINGPGQERAMVFQEFGLLPWRTVLANVELGLELKGTAPSIRRERALDLIKLVGLESFQNHYPHELSGGMKQRVGLARALATEPEVLLMDEPFAALDAQTRDLLHDELERIWAETRRTIVFVTHNVREAVRLGDRVALLTFRPGQVKREYQIDLPRPRHLEDVQVARSAREILNDLRDEINKSIEEEYGLEANS